MSITVTKINQPILELRLLDGGELLPNTTYYFIAIYIYNPSIDGNSAPVFLCSQSPNSIQQSITTSDTSRSISMSWNESGVSGSNLIVKWDTEPLIDAEGNMVNLSSHNKWNTLDGYQIGWEGQQKDINVECLFENNDQMNMLNNPAISFDPKLILDNRIDFKSYGLPYITIDSDESIETIMIEMRRNDISDCFVFGINLLYSYCNIVLRDGTFNWTHESIILVGSKICTNNSKNIRLTNCSFSILGFDNYLYLRGQYNNCDINFSSIGFVDTTDDSEVKYCYIYNSTFGSYNYYNNLNLVGQSLYPSKLIQCNMNKGSSNTGDNNRFLSSFLHLDQNSYYYSIGNEWMNFNKLDFDIKVNVKNNSEEVRQIFKDVKSDRDQNSVVVCFDGSREYFANNYVDFYFTVISNLNDATVRITDNVGREYSNEVLAFTINGDQDNPELFSRKMDFNPFTVHISRSGYISQSFEVNIYEKTTLNIAMTPIPSDKVYQIRHTLYNYKGGNKAKPIKDSRIKLMQCSETFDTYTDTNGKVELISQRKFVLDSNLDISEYYRNGNNWYPLNNFNSEILQSIEIYNPLDAPIYIEANISAEIQDMDIIQANIIEQEIIEVDLIDEQIINADVLANSSINAQLSNIELIQATIVEQEIIEANLIDEQIINTEIL